MYLIFASLPNYGDFAIIKTAKTFTFISELIKLLSYGHYRRSSDRNAGLP